jgi:hypothetical protein
LSPMPVLFYNNKFLLNFWRKWRLKKNAHIMINFARLPCFIQARMKMV